MGRILSPISQWLRFRFIGLIKTRWTAFGLMELRGQKECKVWYTSQDSPRLIPPSTVKGPGQKEHLEAVSLLKQTTATLKRSETDWTQFGATLCTLKFTIFSQVKLNCYSSVWRAISTLSTTLGLWGERWATPGSRPVFCHWSLEEFCQLWVLWSGRLGRLGGTNWPQNGQVRNLLDSVNPLLILLNPFY